MSHFDWFSFFIPSLHGYSYIASALAVLFLLICLTVVVRVALKAAGPAAVIPSPRLSLVNIVEFTVESWLSLMEGIIGPAARHYFPLIGGLFIFVFVSNLLGVIPGFLPPTDNTNTTLALGLTVFLYYNYVGIREQGITHYIGHLMGPIWWLAPLMLIVELIGHFVRPMSLALRLFGNIYGDHMVLGIFMHLTHYLIPILFLVLGIFVSFIQAFVFSLLSTIYISLAVAKEDAHH